MKSSTSTQPDSIAPMDWHIDRLPGLSAKSACQLRERGITTTFQLLKQARSLRQRQALAVQLAVSVQTVNKWLAMADLARIPSVGCQYCGLLLHSGIGSTAQLARSSPETLHKQVTRCQVQMIRRSERCLTIAQICCWIDRARQTIAKSGAQSASL